MTSTNKQAATTDTHWDCECKDYYVHPKTRPHCSICDTDANSQPDSRVDEVPNMTCTVTNVNGFRRLSFDFPDSLYGFWIDEDPTGPKRFNYGGKQYQFLSEAKAAALVDLLKLWKSENGHTD